LSTLGARRTFALDNLPFEGHVAGQARVMLCDQLKHPLGTLEC
jgi:hypothetical protein